MKNRILSSLFLPLFLTSLTLLANSSAFAQIPSSGLVGYWNFSGNLNDASSNGNNGIMQPGNNGSINFVTDRFGNANSAIEFTSPALVGNEMFIFNAVGKLVFKQQLLSTQTTVSVSNLADGNYIVRVGELVKRFVVEK
jgi:hypothetical protein